MTSGTPVVLLNNSRETFTPTTSGAIATCLWELCRSAASEGADPVVVTLGSGDAPYPWPSTHFVSPRTVPESAVVQKAARAARRLTGWARVDQPLYAVRVVPVLARLRPGIVVCNNDPELALYLRKRIPGARVVHWFHNLELMADGPRRRFRADRGIVPVAVSRYLARAVEAVLELEPLSVPVACNGVDTARFHPRGAPAPEGGGRPIFGFVGRICVEKAPDTFLRACLSLARHRQDFGVQLIGDTNWGRSEANPFRCMVDGLVDELTAAGIEVRRPGHVGREAVPGALRATDVHVVPSRWDEPCGLTVLEGLATGVPIVASATGGTPELVGDAGILFPRDDVAALAGALGRLIDEPALRMALGEKARARAESLPWLQTWRTLADAAS